MKRQRYENWTPEKDNTLRELFPATPSAQVAEVMGLTLSQVNCRAFVLGIKKNTEYKRSTQLKSIEQLMRKGVNYRFPKGNVPQNKGKKMSAELRSKCQHTFFTKGHKPHNTKYNGYERTNAEGYIEVRVGDKQFIGKHRLLWEQANGPVPEGMCVIFADGDKTNFDLSNLVCVSRGDLAILNKQKKYGREIAENVLLLSKIKLKLKKINSQK